MNAQRASSDPSAIDLKIRVNDIEIRNRTDGFVALLTKGEKDFLPQISLIFIVPRFSIALNCKPNISGPLEALWSRRERETRFVAGREK